MVLFCRSRCWETASEELQAAVRDQVAALLGEALQPERVSFTTALPKTRNTKVLRRVIRADYLGKEPGDLSSLENPATLDAIRNAT